MSNKPSRRFTPTGWLTWVVPAVLILLLIIFVVTIAISLLSP